MEISEAGTESGVGPSGPPLVDAGDIQPIGMSEPLSVGDVVLVRMRVTKAEPQNDYRGLYYIECADPWDATEPPIPVLRMDVVARDTPH